MFLKILKIFKTNKNKLFFNFLFFGLIIVNFVFVNQFLLASQQTGGEIISIPNPVGAEDFTTLIDNIVDFLFIVLAPIATIVVLYAGVLFMTAGGSTERIQKAKQTLTWAVIGIAILIVSKSITYVIADFLGGK